MKAKTACQQQRQRTALADALDLNKGFIICVVLTDRLLRQEVDLGHVMTSS